MNDYDVRSIFEEMELELIASMKRNLSRHQKWEKDEGINWSMWQVEQLKTLESFKKENQKIFIKKFTTVNNEIAKFLKDTYKSSGFSQEREILKALSRGEKAKSSVQRGLEGGFFSLDEDKMNALIKATTKDMTKAEHAMLRMVNDQYRKTIFKAQVMSNSGAFTLQQSIDRATKDFLKAGINCIEYKDGRRINIASYAEMAIRTANKRAKLVSEGEVRKAYGITTVRISKYGQCSETCLPYQGKVYVDDVWSGGTKEEAKEKNLPLLSEAIAGGLFHPNCKHTMTTYFYDLKKELGKLQEDGIENPIEEQQHRKNQLHIQQQKRLEIGSLNPVNIEQAQKIKEQWIEKDRRLGYDDEWLPFNFEEKTIQKIENSDDVVNEYFKKLHIFSRNTVLKENIKNDLKHMPIKDLEYIRKNKIKIFSSKKESYYGSLLNGKVKYIVLNKSKSKKGLFAHEFAHYVSETKNIDKRLLGCINNVFEKGVTVDYKKYGKKEYVIVKSDLFVRSYQGRTYITKEEFKKNGSTLYNNMLVEYVSVGYETFVTNPQLLYDKDIMLYNYFKNGGLSK